MIFNKEILSLHETELFSKIILDYVNHDLQIKQFSGLFPSINSVKSSLLDVNHDCREDLVQVLEEQYEKTKFNISSIEPVKVNIQQLRDSKSYTVTTGHQIHMFATPLFLIYKIVSTIAYANYLNKHIPEYHCVPCFWMATEDHDFNEISSFTLFDKKYSIDGEKNDAVGNLSSAIFFSILRELKGVLKTTKFGKDLYDIYDFSYKENINYANATRSLLTSFFGKHGLVIIDGNHSCLKKMFIDDFQLEIKNNQTFHSVSATNKLMKTQYTSEINPLSSNIFYLFNSQRSKIQFDGVNYFSHQYGKKWSQLELFKEIESSPELFSPNVFLRTLYQQRIMPNVMYVGGPSEISYWLQLRNLFKSFKINYPILTLRSFFLLLTKLEADFYSKFSSNNNILFKSYDQKVQIILRNLTDLNSDFFKNDKKSFLRSVQNKLKSIDSEGTGSFLVFETRLHKITRQLESKILNSQKNQHQDVMKQIALIQEKLFPGKSIQEKAHSFIPYYMKYGSYFFELLIQESSIFDDKYIILNENE